MGPKFKKRREKEIRVVELNFHMVSIQMVALFERRVLPGAFEVADHSLVFVEELGDLMGERLVVACSGARHSRRRLFPLHRLSALAEVIANAARSSNAGTTLFLT